MDKDKVIKRILMMMIFVGIFKLNPISHTKLSFKLRFVMKIEVNIQSMVDIIFKKKFISVYNYLDKNMS